eukprot:42764_1
MSNNNNNMKNNNNMNNPLLMGMSSNNSNHNMHHGQPMHIGAMNQMMNMGMMMPAMNNNMNNNMNMMNMNNMMQQMNGPMNISSNNNKIINNKKMLSSSKEDFQQAASDIACYNDNPSSVFSTLRSVAKKLLKDDVRYRTLDTTNPKVMERLIGFEGVLDFLMLLGFEADAMGMKLVCEEKPTQQIVRNAIEVLNTYESRLGIGRKKKNGGKDDDEQSFVTLGGPGDNNENEKGKEEEEDTLTLEQIIIWSTHENMRD